MLSSDLSHSLCFFPSLHVDINTIRLMLNLYIPTLTRFYENGFKKCMNTIFTISETAKSKRFSPTAISNCFWIIIQTTHKSDWKSNLGSSSIIIMPEAYSKQTFRKFVLTTAVTGYSDHVCQLWQWRVPEESAIDVKSDNACKVISLLISIHQSTIISLHLISIGYGSTAHSDKFPIYPFYHTLYTIYITNFIMEPLQLDFMESQWTLMIFDI
jgi:hypothetical protein